LDALLSAVEAWRNDLSNFASEAAKHGTRDSSELLTTGREQVRHIAGKIEERPFVSLALAFATGLVIWGLLRR
jgi:hypothetical protein